MLFHVFYAFLALVAFVLIGMAFLPNDTQTAILSAFGGSTGRLDPYTTPQNKALYVQNTAFLDSEAFTRYGHSVVFSIQASYGPVTSMYNWLFAFGGFALGVTPISIALYYCPTQGVGGYKQFPIQNIPASILFPVTGAAGASLVGAGDRLYGAFYDATGRVGVHQPEIYGWNIGTDTLFAPPLQNGITFTEPTTGTVTAGPHKFGFLYTTRNGYTGPLSPVNSQTVFTPVSFTAAGGKNLQVSINGALPAYMIGANAQIQLVMTTTANQAQYFTVPGALQVGIVAGPIIFTINISDNILAQTGTDVGAYQNLLSQTVGGTGPFFPSALTTYSSRMVYVTIDGAGIPVVYISNQNAFQYITADQHGIYLQGQAQPVQCISLRGVLYILTQFATYSVEDSGDVPVLWTPPQLVDGSIGILSPTCVTVNPSQGYAGIASDRGFFIFQGGIYPALPLSYYQQPDWNRINWNVPTTVQVVDDVLNKRFIVLAPLSNTVASVSGGGPFTITTTITPHLYQTGVSMSIAGVTGNHTITVTGPNTFTIPGGSGAPTVGGKILPQTATHRLTWNYAQGDTPQTVQYSLDNFSAYNAGAIAVVQNINTYLQEVWYAPSVQGVAIRQNDGTEALPYQDVDSTGTPTSYSWLYETALLPGPVEGSSTVPDSTLHRFVGAHFRVTGTGSLALQIFGLDHKISITPVLSPLTLSPNPGQEYPVKWNFFSEQESIQFGMTVMNSNAVLSLIRAYYTEYAPQRNG